MIDCITNKRNFFNNDTVKYVSSFIYCYISIAATNTYFFKVAIIKVIFSTSNSRSVLQFAWLRNEQKLPKNDTRWVMKPDGGLYTGVGGKYQCLVTNNAGALLSNVARLRVASKFMFFVTILVRDQ